MKRSRRFVLASLVVALTFVGTYAVASANLLVNPGFEASGGSYDGWTVFASGAQISTPEDDDIYLSGTAAAKIYGEFTNCPNNPQFDDGVVYQEFAVTPGVEYEFSGYSFVSVADTIPGSDTCLGNRLLAKVVYFNGLGGEMSGNEVVLGDWSTPRDQWIPFSVKAPVPAGAATVQALLVFLQPACDEGSVFVDDCVLVEVAPSTEPNVLVNPSFDTDLSGWSTFSNAYYDGRFWAHLSSPGSCELYGSFEAGNDAGIYQQFPATAGSTWKFDLNVMTTCRETPIQPGNSNVVVANLTYKDGTGAIIGTDEEVVLVGDTVPIGTWVDHSLIATTPAGTESIAAYVLFVQDPEVLDQGSAFVDDLRLYDISSVGVDGTFGTKATLHQNMPNPFNPKTKIAFELPKRSDVDVIIYNTAGREVATLFQGVLPAGPHSLTWDGKTADGKTAASGIYWYMLRTADGQTARSMVLLK